MRIRKLEIGRLQVVRRPDRRPLRHTTSSASSGRTAAASRTSSTPSAGAWGSSSAKHLRGRSMSDVIFNGSEHRGPHGMAEVTLTFENGDPEIAATLPIEYRDYGEIAVTRRLFRDGDERVPDQQDPGAPQGHHRPLPRHRRRHQGVLHHRAGQDRPHRLGPAGGSAHADRGGRRHHQVQGAEEAGRAEDGADAAEPAAHRRHRRGDSSGASPPSSARPPRPSATSPTRTSWRT